MIAVFIVVLCILYGCFIGRCVSKVARRYKKQAETKSEQISMLSQMIHQLAQEEIGDWYHHNGYKDIIIYGYGIVGKRYCDSLKNRDINIIAIVDRKKMSSYGNILFLSPDDELPEADAMIITPISSYDAIKKAMENKVNCPIHSLEEALYCL